MLDSLLTLMFIRKIVLPIIISFFITAYHTSATSYDIYVDKDYDGDEEGTVDKPFNTIEEALDEVDSMGKKIYIKNGNYEERIVLSKGVELYGQDKNETIITGNNISMHTVTAKEKNKLQNLTVTGGSIAVLFEGEGEIKNCIIKNAKNKGIDLVSGGADFTIERSKIINNGGKGIYVQRGRRIKIIDNEINNNYGEGIDIREKINGTISGNEIKSNEESGVELIVGRSSLQIINNNIRNNKASGIAAQFYDHADKNGKISVMNNDVIGNSSYGFNCKAPSGGGIPKGYWNDSIELLDNKIQSNKKKSIAGACKFIQAVSEEEEKNNQSLESPEALQDPEESVTEIKKEQQEDIQDEKQAQEAMTKEKALIDRFDGIVADQHNSLANIMAQTESILKMGKFKILFFGPDIKKLNSINQELKNIADKVVELDKINQEIENLGNANKVRENTSIIKNVRYQTAKYRAFLQQQNKKTSLFGWITKYFKR